MGALLASVRQQKTHRLDENSGFFDVHKPTWTMSWRRRWTPYWSLHTAWTLGSVPPSCTHTLSRTLKLACIRILSKLH